MSMLVHFQSIVFFPPAILPTMHWQKAEAFARIKARPRAGVPSRNPFGRRATERFRAIGHPAINNTEIQREKPANGHTSESMNHAGQTDLDSLSKQSSSSLCYLERPSITSACLFSTKQWTFGPEEHQWGFERRQADELRLFISVW